MKFDLVSPHTAVPGGWRYEQPVTGARFAGHTTLAELMRELNEHEDANGLEATRPSVVHDYTMDYLLDHHPHTIKVTEPPKRTLSQYWSGLNGLKLIIQFERSGRPVQVTEAHAWERAAICINCPFNVPPVKSQLREFSDRQMLKMAGGRDFKGQLKNCAKCSCPLPAKVNLTIELLAASGEEPKGYPDFCWVRKELSRI